MKIKLRYIILISIFVLAAILRFYNFPSRVTFWTEQARSLIVSADYLRKPSLLGQEYFRQDSNAHTIYSGAYFNYLLVPLLLIANYDPVKITIFFALINLFTGFMIYWVVNKIYGFKLAVISSALFLFNDYMIYHSLFIWNYNLLPLTGILLFYSLYKKKSLLSGLLAGIGVSLQIMFAPFALAAFIYSVWKSKKKIPDSLLFIAGMLLGNLPLVLFDLRHQFFQTKSLMQYLLDTLAGKSDATLNYYYLLALWPIFAVAGAYFIFKIYKFNKIIAVGIAVIYLYLNFTSAKINFTSPTGMPEGLKTSDINYASWVISKDSASAFNVASVLDFDKRAYYLRYYVQYKYGKSPMDVTAYPDSKTIYVLAGKDFDFEKSNIWEIKSGGKYNVKLLSDIGQGYGLFKLSK